MRVYKNRIHHNADKAYGLKDINGVVMSYLKDIITDGHRMYSMAMVHEWAREQTEEMAKRGRYITDELKSMGIRHCVFGLEFYHDSQWWSHANTWKWTEEAGWALFDHFYDNYKMERFPYKG